MNPELVAKYADQTQFPRMLGTGGTMDYLIVAKRPEVNLQLGVKPLMQMGPNGPVQVGFRLRSAPIPQEDTVVHQFGQQPGYTQGYPSTGWDFPWEKVSEERASLIRLFSFDRKPSEIGFIWEDLKQHRFYGKLMSFLMEKAEEAQWVVTPEQLTEYVQAQLYKPVLKVTAMHDPKAKLQLLNETEADVTDKIAKQKAELEAQIAAGGGATTQPAEYKPAAASEDFETMGSVSANLLQGMKPSLSLVEDTGTSLNEMAADALGGVEDDDDAEEGAEFEGFDSDLDGEDED